jgi:ligand-binding SRPBCC domain-containing protein
MHLKIITKVNQSYRSVMQGFNQQLFEKLNPPFPPVKLLRFDGSKKGDVVSMQLNFIFFRQPWTSLIVEDGLDAKEAYFIDEGIKLPFFLTYWRHCHRVVKDKQHALIIDDIHFKTPFRLLDYLMYPVMWLQFVYRKPVYKRVFR